MTMRWCNENLGMNLCTQVIMIKQEISKKLDSLMSTTHELEPTEDVTLHFAFDSTLQHSLSTVAEFKTAEKGKDSTGPRVAIFVSGGWNKASYILCTQI